MKQPRKEEKKEGEMMGMVSSNVRVERKSANAAVVSGSNSRNNVGQHGAFGGEGGEERERGREREREKGMVEG